MAVTRLRLAAWVALHPWLAYRFHRAATAPWPTEVAA